MFQIWNVTLLEPSLFVTLCCTYSRGIKIISERIKFYLDNPRFLTLAISELPECQRGVMHLVRCGDSHTEIAKFLGYSRNLVSHLYNDGLDNLRKNG